MHMTTPGPLKHAGYKYVILVKVSAADRADSGQIPVKAVHTAPYMHQPVPAAGEGGEGHRLYQIALEQFC